MSWLFIARYNHQAWKKLTESEEAEARTAAVELFPYEGYEQTLDSPIGFTIVDTFRSASFAKLPHGYTDLSKAERAEVMDEIFAGLPDDKGIGWIAIVPDDQVGPLRALLGDKKSGTDKPLKRMYTIEMIPLNEDQTTAEIYEHMTPSHWS